jgi:hypothetical protein
LKKDFVEENRVNNMEVALCSVKFAEKKRYFEKDER